MATLGEELRRIRLARRGVRLPQFQQAGLPQTVGAEGPGSPPSDSEPPPPEREEERRRREVARQQALEAQRLSDPFSGITFSGLPPLANTTIDQPTQPPPRVTSPLSAREVIGDEPPRTPLVDLEEEDGGDVLDLADFPVHPFEFESTMDFDVGVDTPFSEEDGVAVDLFYNFGEGRNFAEVFMTEQGPMAVGPDGGIRSATNEEIRRHQKRLDDFKKVDAIRAAARNRKEAEFGAGLERETSEIIENLRADNEARKEAFKQSMLNQRAAADRALQREDLEESKRANIELERLRAQQVEIERRGQDIALFTAIASNPALLFFMGRSGLPGTLAKNLGIDISMFLPGEIPQGIPFNVQELQAMTPQQRQFALFAASATTGIPMEQIMQQVQGEAPGARRL